MQLPKEKHFTRKIICSKRPPRALVVLVWCCTTGLIFRLVSEAHGLRKFSSSDMYRMREKVRQMFQHAYDGYLQYAAPYDELRPLSCDGIDTWGSYSLTLIDALDTLAVMGNYTEFGRVVQMLQGRSFDADINVSVFETNIRIIGGLLSAHLLSNHADLKSMGLVEPGWPCQGPLLDIAEEVAQRLLPAFDTATGMPYGTVNLRHGVPYGETTVTCTAGIGTFILEFGTLSRLTGNPVYEDVAMNALSALYKHRSPIGLYGNHIDVQTGRWIAQDAGIGAGVDSYFEYLVKGSILLENPALMATFFESKASIDRYLKREDWYVWVSMSKGQLTLPVFQSLEAYWPGLLTLYGNTKEALKVLHNYQTVWRQYGFLPEFYNIPTGEAGANRENYPLRPELIESVMYLYRATSDPFLLQVGENILESIEHSAKTPCGYATIRNVLTHQQEDRMESFFLAETTKYLYLLFDPNNVLHNDGSIGNVVKTILNDGVTKEHKCVVGAGGYIFNTEAHPMDPTALRCCEARHINIFANALVENQMNKKERRGKLLFAKGQQYLPNTKNRQDKKNEWMITEPKEPPKMTDVKVELKGGEKMATTKLPINTINREIEETESVSRGIKTKNMYSSESISKTNHMKSIKEQFSQSFKDEINHATAFSLLPVDKATTNAASSNKAKSSSTKKVSEILLMKKSEEEFTPVTVQSYSTTRYSASTKDKNGNEEDTPMATMLKLVQSMFHTTANLAQKRSVFDLENFYQQVVNNRLLNDESGNFNISGMSSPSYNKEKILNGLLTCRSQPFLQRLTLIGEFY